MSKTEEKLDKIKGKPITCQLCGFKFSMIDPEKRKEWYESNFICPSCGESYVMLPETERILRKLQDSYFACNRNDKYLTEMYKILLSYSKSLLKKHFANRLHDFEGALDYYAHTASQLLVMRYLQKDDFIITVSFGQFLMKKILESIFGKFEHSLFGDVVIGKDKKGEIVKGSVDTINFIFEDGNTVDYEDKKKSLLNNIEEVEDKKSLCLFLCQLIFDIKSKCYSRSENYARLMAVEHFLTTQKELWTDRLFELYGREGKETYDCTMQLIKTYLMKSSEISLTYDKQIEEMKERGKNERTNYTNK